MPSEEQVRPERGLTSQSLDQAHPTVVLCDPSHMTTELLRKALEESCEGIRVLSYATTSELAISAIESYSPSVALISAALADGARSGFRVLREIRRAGRRSKAIVIFDDRDPELIVDAFRTGARGVFFRTEPLGALCKSILRVHQGQVWASNQDLEYILQALADGTGGRITDAKGTIILSPREDQIVALLVSEGCTNRELAERLNLSEHTVKNYLFKIFDKLGVSNRVELIFYATKHRACIRVSNDDRAA